MRFPRAVAVFNKHATNHVQGLWAWLVPPWAVIHHVGRKTGKAFKTPVLGFHTPEGFAVPMLYGPSTHWAKNVLAAGEGEVQRAGKHYGLVDPKIVSPLEITAGGLAGRYTRAGETTFVATLVRRA